MIPSSVKEIEDEAFFNCNLESIIVAPKNSNYVSIHNCLLDSSKTKLILGCRSSRIPNGVEVIERSAFEGCTSLEKIDIPESVKEIMPKAFCGCTNLKIINIGQKENIEIAKDAFKDCPKAIEIGLYDDYWDKFFEECEREEHE